MCSKDKNMYQELISKVKNQNNLMAYIDDKDKRHVNLCCIAVLCLLNFLWCMPLLEKGCIMGDDINLYWFTCNRPGVSPLSIIFQVSLDGKFRPVFYLYQYIVSNLFGTEYAPYFYMNVLIHTSIIVVFYFFVYKLTQKRSIAFAMSFLLVGNIYTYYGITQLFGTMEEIAVLFTLCAMYFYVSYYQKKEKKTLLLALLMATLASFTHERYIVLSPFFVIAVVFCDTNIRTKILDVVLSTLPILVNAWVKNQLLGISVLVGTGGASGELNIGRIVGFFADGLLAVFGVNTGVEHLHGLTFDRYPAWEKLITIVYVVSSFVLLGIYIVRCIIQEPSAEKRKAEGSRLIIAACGIGAVLLSGCVTTRLETRWIFPATVLYLLYYAYIFSKTYKKFPAVGICLVIAVLVCSANSVSYRKYCDGLHFMRAMKMAKSVNANVIEKYGDELSEYELYFVENNELHWAIGDHYKTLFDIHTDSDVNVNYVKDIDSLKDLGIDLQNVKLFKLSSTMEVEEHYILTGYDTVSKLSLNEATHTIAPDSYVDTPNGKGVFSLEKDSITVLSRHSDKIESVQFPENSYIYFIQELPFASSDGASVEIVLINDQERTVIYANDVTHQQGKQVNLIPINNADAFTGDLLINVSSPTGNDQADWISFHNISVVVRSGQN